MPIITEWDLADVRAESDDGLIHTARRIRQPTVTLPNEEVEPVGTPTLGPEICCLLTETDYTAAEIAASSGVLTRWLFHPPSGVRVPIGSQWRVTGDDPDCEPWTETVEIAGHVAKHGPVMRLFAAVDVPLDA